MTEPKATGEGRERTRYPYPGLRPFMREDHPVFFGRAEQIDDMLTCLEDTRFLAVVGSSGCGKSSLVRAGLLPAIERGFLVMPGMDAEGNGGRWRFIQMRPGKDPFWNLAEAIREASLGEGEQLDPDLVAFTEVTLRSGRNGFQEAAADAGLGEERLLLLVDQFEELFRLNQQAASGDLESGKSRAGIREDSVAFVNLLLHTAEIEDSCVPVILTMRSDWIGHCDAFRGLPEAVSESQFLTPRMTRAQLQQAIERPLKLFGAKAEPALVNRILNEVGSDMDQLPRMQHAMMRTAFEAASAERWESGECKVTLQVDHYDRVGGFSGALSAHLEEAWRELKGNKEDEAIVRHLFLLLCEMGKRGGELTRRFATVEKVAEVAGCSVEKVADLVDVFRRDHRSFLVAPDRSLIIGETQLDISHEALLRRWGRIEKWIEKEAVSAKEYQTLAEAAVRGGSLWSDPELASALAWKERQKPTAAWAERYPPEVPGIEVGDHFEKAMEFLEKSRVERQKRRRRIAAIVTSIIIVLTSVSVVAGVGWKRAAKSERDALEARDLEKTAKEEAVREKAKSRFGELTSAAEAAHIEGKGTKAWLYTLEALHVLPPDEALPPHSAGHLVAYRLEAEAHDAGGVDASASAVNREGTLLAAGDGNEVQLWNLATGARIRGLTGHSKRVRSLSFSGDGKWLACGSEDALVSVWHVGSGALEHTLHPYGGEVYAVSFSGDGSALAAGGFDGGIRVWDTSDYAAEPRILRREGSVAKSSVLALSFSEVGEILVAGYKDRKGSVGRWKWRTDEPAVEEMELGSFPKWVSVDPKGEWVAAGSKEKVLWSPVDTDGVKDVAIPDYGEISGMTMSGDGALLAVSSAEGGIGVWNRKGERVDHLPGRGSARFLGMGGKGKWLASSPEEGGVRMWRLGEPGDRFAEVPPDKKVSASEKNWLPVRESPPEGEENLSCLARSRSGAWLAAGDDEGGIHLWKKDAGKWVALGSPGRGAHTKGETVISLAFSPNEQWLVSGSRDKTVKLWSLADADQPKEASKKGHGQAVLCVAANDAGMFVSGDRNGTIKVWTKEEKKTPTEGELEPPPGDQAGPVIEGTDEPLRSINVPVPEPPAVSSIVFEKEARVVAGYRDGTVRRWDLSGEKEGAAEVFSLHTQKVSRIVAGGAGWLATSSWDKTVNLVSSATPLKSPITLAGHDSEVTGLDLSGDGRWIVSGTQKGSIYLWQLLPSPERTLPVADLVAVWRLRREQAELPGIVAVEFDRSAGAWNRLISLARDGRIEGWELGLLEEVLRDRNSEAISTLRKRAFEQASGYRWIDGSLERTVSPLRPQGGFRFSPR